MEEEGTRKEYLSWVIFVCYWCQVSRSSRLHRLVGATTASFLSLFLSPVLILSMSVFVCVSNELYPFTASFLFCILPCPPNGQPSLPFPLTFN